MGEGIELGAHRLVERRMAVAVDHAPPGGHRVDQRPVLFGVQQDAPGVEHAQGRRHAYEHDPITDLYNRTAFFAETRRLLDRNPQTKFALVRFDIDHFQAYNSYWGEEEGDRLLRFVADCLREVARRRPLCVYGRINADAFCLCMSRLENGKYTLNPAPCDTGELFGGVIEPIRALADKKGVRFEDNIASLRRRTVRTDGLSLQKILLNLLTNAVKFTPPGGRVSLDCHLEPADGAQPETVLIVSDTGAGISREFLPHIFEPFAQEHADNADTAGSGMMEENRECEDILMQLSAAESAIDKVAKIILKEHLNHCVKESIERGETESLEKFNRILDKYL